MDRLRYRSWLLGVVLLSFVVTRPLLAVGPSIIMFYGASLQRPIVIRGEDLPSDLPLAWRSGMQFVQPTPWTPPAGLDGRPYVKVAIFWGLGFFKDRVALIRTLNSPTLPDQLKPEDASQHGRLYFQTATEPAVMVVTFPAMERLKGTSCKERTPPSDYAPCPIAIPTKLGDFYASWNLNIDVAKWLAITPF